MRTCGFGGFPAAAADGNAGRKKSRRAKRPAPRKSRGASKAALRTFDEGNERAEGGDAGDRVDI